MKYNKFLYTKKGEYRPPKKIYILVLYISFFILIYNESLKIGGISLSILWKTPILIFIFIKIINFKSRLINPRFNKFAYGYGIVKLFNIGIFEHFLTTISDFSRYITFPLLYNYLSHRLKSTKIIYSFLFFISQFIVLSFIPFLLRILTSKKVLDIKESTLEILEEANRTSGIFGSSHGASALLALSIIFLVHYLMSKQHHKMLKAYLLFLIAIAFWAIFSTYARGGWVMCIIGLLVLLIKNNIRYISLCIFMFISLSISINYLMQHNEYFYNRITDRNEQGIKNAPDRIGSGRLWFAQNGIMFWLSSTNIQEILTGQGITRLMEYQKQKTGLYIYCHNGYIDALAQNGIVGFLCLSLFNIYALIYVIKRKHSAYHRLCTTIVIMYITFQLLQGGAAPYSDLFYVLTLQLSRIGEIEFKRNKIVNHKLKLIQNDSL